MYSAPSGCGLRGDSPVTADYVAPHHEGSCRPRRPCSLQGTAATLTPSRRRLSRTPNLKRSTLSLDGNGRTGRALISALLLARGVTRHVILPVSTPGCCTIPTGTFRRSPTTVQAMLAHHRALHRRRAKAITNAESWRKTLKPCAMRVLSIAQRKTLSCVPSLTYAD